MDEKTKINEISQAFTGVKPEKKTNTNKRDLLLLVIGVIFILGGGGCILYSFLSQPEKSEAVVFPELREESVDEVYSDLTGEKLASADLKTAPTFCIQTPNGTDGARPQAGLNEAGVVFEAIAEAGITRFAAIYQNPSTAIIGPIRSLRLYYLEWDTPFDCTIVHAGGAANALAAVASGGYKDLSEDYNYMYRGTYGGRLWNNLFTTSSYLKKFSSEHGYNTSNIKGFKRMTPAESNKSRAEKLAKNALNITKPTSGNTSEIAAEVSSVNINYGSTPSFNVIYTYDIAKNVYLRSYQSGATHDVYACAAEDLGEVNPEDTCNSTQIAPSVVVAMVVQESRDFDNYHERITTTGSGDAYIFQNGISIKGRWSKSSPAEQITFADENGEEIALAPGQTFISAVPTYGSIDY